MKGDFVSNLGKVYGIYTGGFVAFVVLLAILEQIGVPNQIIGYLFVFFTNWFCEVPRFTTTANAFVSGANLFPSSDVWTFVGITYSESDGVRIYRGTLSTPMVELSYVSRTVGVGATLACDGNLIIGNRSASSTLAPRHNIAHVSLWDQILTVEHMNLLRIFPYAAAHRFSVGGTVVNLKSYHPLTESAVATALDHSGNGNNGTVTGMSLVADPPFAWTRRGVRAVIVTPGAAAGGIPTLVGPRFSLAGPRGLAG